MTFCEYTKYHETYNAFYWESAPDTLKIREYREHFRYVSAPDILVLEMSHACAEHCNAALIGLLDRILVTDASARLNDSLDSVFCCEGYSIIEWEETV